MIGPSQSQRKGRHVVSFVHDREHWTPDLSVGSDCATVALSCSGADSGVWVGCHRSGGENRRSFSLSAVFAKCITTVCRHRTSAVPELFEEPTARRVRRSCVGRRYVATEPTLDEENAASRRMLAIRRLYA